MGRVETGVLVWLLVGVSVVCAQTSVAPVPSTTPAFGPPPEVTLSVELPPERVRAGLPFELTMTVRWQGRPNAWQVASWDGPALSGLRECFHRVRSRVEGGGSLPVALQFHHVGLVADGAGAGEIGRVEVRLATPGGQQRVLTTKPLRVEVAPAPFSLNSAEGRTVLAVVCALVVLVVLGVVVVRRRRRRAEEARLAALAEEETDTVRSRALEELQTLVSGDDCKAFYGKAMEILVDVLSVCGSPGLRPSDNDAVAEALESAQVPSGARRGLKKVVEDERLVRFAGLRPDRPEREQVLSRLRELVERVDGGRAEENEDYDE